MKKENYCVTYGWMSIDLHLKGFEKELFAIIYCFSKSKNEKFIGSLSYLSTFLGCTRRNVVNLINKLIDKGYIEKKSGLNKDGNVDNYYYSLIDYDKKNDRIILVNSEKSIDHSEKISLAPLGKIETPPREICDMTPLYIYSNNNTIGKTDEKEADLIKSETQTLNTFEKKEKEKSSAKKEKEKEFLDRYNEEREIIKKKPSQIRLLDAKCVRQLHAALEIGLSIEDIMNVFKNAAKEKNHIESGWKWLTPEFITRADKINIYIESIEPQPSYELAKNGDFD